MLSYASCASTQHVAAQVVFDDDKTVLLKVSPGPEGLRDFQVRRSTAVLDLRAS